jgi:hypothetical protein
MNTVSKFILLFLVIFISSCTTAKRAKDIPVVRVSSAPYLKMTCQELGVERRITVERLEAARRNVDDKYSSEKNTELVTWILFAPAAFFLEGNAEEAAAFAQAKGTYEAIEEARTINKCE